MGVGVGGVDTAASSPVAFFRAAWAVGWGGERKVRRTCGAVPKALALLGVVMEGREKETGSAEGVVAKTRRSPVVLVLRIDQKAEKPKKRGKN